MDVLARFADARNTVEGKILSVVMAVLLATSLFNAPLFVSQANANEGISDMGAAVESPATTNADDPSLGDDPSTSPEAEVIVDETADEASSETDEQEEVAVAVEIEGDASLVYNEEFYTNEDELILTAGEEAYFWIDAADEAVVTVKAVFADDESEDSEAVEESSDLDESADPEEANAIELKADPDGWYLLDTESVTANLEALVVEAVIEEPIIDEEVAEPKDSSESESDPEDGPITDRDDVTPTDGPASEEPSDPEVFVEDSESVGSAEVVEPEVVTEPTETVEPQETLVPEEPTEVVEPETSEAEPVGSLKPIVATGEEGVAAVQGSLEENLFFTNKEIALLANSDREFPLKTIYIEEGSEETIQIKSLNNNSKVTINNNEDVADVSVEKSSQNAHCLKINAKKVGTAEITISINTGQGSQKVIIHVIQKNSSSMQEQHVDFYLLYPGVNSPDEAKTGDWLYAGSGKAKLPTPGVQKKRLYPPIFDVNSIIVSPEYYKTQTITVENETYKFPITPDPDASTFSIVWDSAIYTDGSKDQHKWDGQDGVETLITDGPVYHIDGHLEFHKAGYINVGFKVKYPDATGFSLVENSFKLVEQGIALNKIGCPSTADVPPSKTIGGKTYYFDGWYEDEQCTKEVDFNSATIKLSQTTYWYGRYVEGCDYAINYYKGSKIEDNKIGEPIIVKDVKLGSQITLTYNQLNAKKPEVGYGNGAQQGNVPYIIQEDENNIDVVYPVDEQQTKILNYTVEYYKDGTKVDSGTQTVAQTVQVLQPDTLTVDKPAINTTNKYVGYELDRTEPSVLPDTIEDKGVIRVYYKAINYPITYDFDGGVLAADKTNPNTYTVTTPNFTLVNPAKLGYTFAGWTGTDLDEATQTVTVEQGAIGERSYTATWTANEARIVFVPNNNESIGDKVGATDQVIDDCEMPTVAKPGYVFDGWYNNKGCTGAAVTSLPKVFPAGTTIYYAKWIEKEYVTLTYEVGMGKGTVTLSSEQINPETGVAIGSKATPAEGYKFGGWFIDPQCVKPAANEGVEEYKPSKPENGPWVSAIYYAKFEPLFANIVFNTNGGSNVGGLEGETDQPIADGDRIMPTTIKSGYTFDGWYASADLTGKKVETLPEAFPAGTTIYYAKWVANPQVTYKVECYLQDLDSLEYFREDSFTKEITGIVGVTVDAVPHEISGFKHVVTNDSVEQAIIAEDGSTTLKVYYDRNSYTLKYEYSGIVPVGAPELNFKLSYGTMHCYGELIDVASNPSPLQGYTFSGWTRGNGPAGERFSMPAHDVLMTGSWVKDEYKIEYNGLDGASFGGEVSNRITYAVDTETFTLVNPTKPGYIFAGWIGTGLTGPTKEVVIPQGSTGDRTYTATWTTANTTYQVRYYWQNTDDNEYVLHETQSLSGAVGETVNAEILEYEGFKKVEKYESVESAEIKADGKTVLKVYYDRLTYPIIYAYQNAPENAPALPQAHQYRYGATVNFASAPTLKGYTFSGWSEDLVKTMPVGGLTVVGIWTPITHTVIYTDGVKGETVFEDQQRQVQEGSPTPVFALNGKNEPERRGYTFVGWNPQVVPTVTADATYAAQWEENTATLTYQTVGGGLVAISPGTSGGSTVSETLKVNTGFAKGATALPAVGYEFDGWYAGADCTGNKLSGDNPEFTPRKSGTAFWANTTYYAKFVKDEKQTKPTSYTVKHVVGGVEQTNDTQTYTDTAWINETNPKIEIKADSLAQNTYAGYRYVNTSPVAQEGDSVDSGTTITLTYVRDDEQTKETSYTVKHIVDGKEQTDDTETYKGSAWINEANPTIAIVEGSLAPKTYTGYKYDSTVYDPEVADSENLTEVASGTVIEINYVKDEKQTKPTSYSVEYYKDGQRVAADSYTRTGTAWVNEEAPKIEIQETIDTSLNKYQGYVLSNAEPAIVPAKGALVNSGTVIKIYYTANTYTVTYTDGVSNENIFADQVHNAKYGTQTPAFSGGTPTRAGYTFVGWSPSVASTVSGDVTYTAQWRANTHTVTYRYAGTVPSDADEPPARQTVAFGQTVQVSQSVPTALGYTFAGWDRTESFTMPDHNVTITGSWTPNDDTTYYVEYFLQNEAGNGYEWNETLEYTGTTGARVQADAPAREGFSHVVVPGASVESAIIAANGTTTLRVYYNRNTYTVRYQYLGTVPAGASALPATQTYRYGQVVTVAPEATASGYTFSGWDFVGDFDMPAYNVVLSGSFEAEPIVPGGITPTPNPPTPPSPINPTPTPTPDVTPTPDQPTNPTPTPGQTTTTNPPASITPVQANYSPVTPGQQQTPRATTGQTVQANLTTTPTVQTQSLPTVTRPATTPAQQTPAVETIDDNATPMAAPASVSAEAPEIVDIQDNPIPMAAPVQHHCWVHIWMIIGLVLTVVYGLVVVVRRRSLTRPLDDYEEDVLRPVDDTTSATVTRGYKVA